jgi:hypothetical protein
MTEQQEQVTTEAAPDSVPFFQPERGKNETFADYKDRRRACNEYTKNLVKRGTLFHDSLRAGTYTKN